MEQSQLPNKSLQIIRIPESEVLSILCDYFLDNNPASFNNWSARFVDGDNGREFVAVFGSTDDPVYKFIKKELFADK